MKSFLALAVFGTLIAGAAWAQPGGHDKEFAFRCLFEQQGQKKEAIQCHAVGRIEIEKDHNGPGPSNGPGNGPGHDEESRMRIVCNDREVFEGDVKAKFEEDFWDKALIIKGRGLGSPVIRVEDFKIGHGGPGNTGHDEHGDKLFDASLTLPYAPPVTLTGRCEFRKLHENNGPGPGSN